MKSLLISIALLLMSFTSPVANAEPNELTRQFCSGMKTMARQVKEGRALGMSQADYISVIADVTHKFADTTNFEQVVRISEAIVKGAWLTPADPETYSEFVHITCLEEIVLEP